MKATWMLLAVITCLISGSCDGSPRDQRSAQSAGDQAQQSASADTLPLQSTPSPTEGDSSAAQPEDIPDDQLRVVSLRTLQDSLRSASTRSAAELGGLTRVLGYVVDDANADLLLYGQAEPTRPPLRVDDFAVALRNAWLKYAERRGNTIYIEHPGCSIDPNPDVVRELQQLFDSIEQTQDADIEDAGFEQWLQVARSPQKVRVLGIPFSTHFAAVTVDADYFMKRLADASETIDVPGWVSLADLRINEVKKQLAAGGNVTIPAASMDRFWFCAGETRYAKDDGIVLVTKSDVALLTEQEHVSGSGHLSGTGMQDMYAAEFASTFTRLYPDVALRDNRYWELGELFRLVTLATVMKGEVGLEKYLGFLLDGYEMPEVEVAATVAGIANIRKLEHSREVSGGTATMTMWSCSCGGVEIAPEPVVDVIDGKRQEWLARVRSSALAGRPDAGAAHWTISGLR